MAFAFYHARTGNDRKRVMGADSQLADANRIGHEKSKNHKSKVNLLPQYSPSPSRSSETIRTFSSVWSFVPAEAAWAAKALPPRRRLRYSYAAPMKALKSGCGSRGRDLNSGWNWQPRNQG